MVSVLPWLVRLPPDRRIGQCLVSSCFGIEGAPKQTNVLYGEYLFKTVKHYLMQSQEHAIVKLVFVCKT